MKRRNKRALTEDEMYQMACLNGNSTGLSQVIWVGPKGKARHVSRIEVQRQKGMKATGDDIVAVTISDVPRVVAGSGLSQDDFTLVKQFIILNKHTLLLYWNDEIGTKEMCSGIKRI